MANSFIQNAPQAMQMIAPDIAAQQVALQRQQQLADMLKQQAMAAPDKTEVVGGYAVKQSPLIGLAKVLQAYMGGKMQADGDAKGLELGKALQGRYGDILGGGATAPDYAKDPNGTGGAMPGQLGSGMVETEDAPQGSGTPILPASGLPVVPPAGAAPQQAPNNFNMNNLMKSQVIEALGGNAAGGAFWDQFKNPDAVKTMDALGQNRQLMGALATAKAKKEGILELQPGTTAIDLSNGQERFQPKVGEGIGLNNGVASPLSGYAAANAGIKGAEAGAVASATEAAKQPYLPPTPVNTPNGQRLMTPKQQIDLANGAQGLDISKLTPQQIVYFAKTEPQAFATGVADFNGGTSAQLGAPLQTPAEAKVAEATGDAAINAAKVRESTKPLLSAIDQALAINDKVPHGSFGMAEMQRHLSNLPLVGGGQDAKYAGQWDQLMGQNIMNGIASSGLSRMDIPIVNAIKNANGIPMENHPDARKQMLLQLRDLVQNHEASSQNVVPALNQPGITRNASPAPMSGASAIPQGAAQLLKTNPNLRAQFEAKYGSGSAASILGN